VLGAIEVGVILSKILGLLCPHAIVVIPRVVLLAAILLLRGQVCARCVLHVVRLVAIVEAGLVGPFPVRIEKTSCADVVELAHAGQVVPTEVGRAALVQGGVEILGWIRRHVVRLSAIVLAAIAAWGPIRIILVRRGGVGRGAGWSA